MKDYPQTSMLGMCKSKRNATGEHNRDFTCNTWRSGLVFNLRCYTCSTQPNHGTWKHIIEHSAFSGHQENFIFSKKVSKTVKNNRHVNSFKRSVSTKKDSLDFKELVLPDLATCVQTGKGKVSVYWPSGLGDNRPGGTMDLGDHRPRVQRVDPKFKY